MSTQSAPAYTNNLPPAGRALPPAARRQGPLPSRRHCSVLGLKVDELDYASVIGQICRWAEAHESRYVCVSAVHMVMEAYDDPDFRAIGNAADLVAVDGVPVVWVSRWLGLTRQQRVFAPELTVRLCEMAADAG